MGGLKVGDWVVLSEYFKANYPWDGANQEFGNRPRKVVIENGSHWPYELEGLKDRSFKREWLTVCKPCKFMKKYGGG